RELCQRGVSGRERERLRGEIPTHWIAPEPPERAHPDGAAAPSERGDDERELARLSGLERAQERGANASARHVLGELERRAARVGVLEEGRKSTRLNSSHVKI